jgi:uncharacterized protein YndB with AHSA1/START domain
MTTQLQATSVSTSVEVDAPAEHAFRVFTEGIGSWWDPSHHILEAELAEMVFEPYAGGHIIDRGTDGSECRWGRVLAYDPPRRVCFSWDINLRWQLETDLAKTSEVVVTFTPTAPHAPGSYLPTATSTVMATAGRACGTRSAQAGALPASPKSPPSADTAGGSRVPGGPPQHRPRAPPGLFWLVFA